MSANGFSFWRSFLIMKYSLWSLFSILGPSHFILIRDHSSLLAKRQQQDSLPTYKSNQEL